MNNSNISIQDRTRNFANRVIFAYVELNKKNYDDAGKVLSKQFLRSGFKNKISLNARRA
jgi:hypothetical protein